MIVLSTTNDTIQLVLGGTVATNQLDAFASYRDITTTTYSPERTSVASNNTSDVNLVPAPAASTQRVIDFLNVFNRDTAASTVTLKLDVSGTERILWRGVLAPSERVEYSEGAGFRAFTAEGSIKGLGATGPAGVNGAGTVLGYGTSIIDFGSQGSNHTTLAVTGQAAIVSGSLVFCWVKPEATLDHSADEHIAEDIIVYASDIIAATGFTLHAKSGQGVISAPAVQRLARFSGTGQDFGPGQAARNNLPTPGAKTPLLFGRWSIGWIYTQ